jgi:hypothetical protein
MGRVLAYIRHPKMWIYPYVTLFLGTHDLLHGSHVGV